MCVCVHSGRGGSLSGCNLVNTRKSGAAASLVSFRGDENFRVFEISLVFVYLYTFSISFQITVINSFFTILNNLFDIR